MKIFEQQQEAISTYRRRVEGNERKGAAAGVSGSALTRRAAEERTRALKLLEARGLAVRDVK